MMIAHVAFAIPCLFLPAASWQAPVEPLPILATYAAATTTTLFTRAQCPANSVPCSTSLGAVFVGVCCQVGQSCALDANNQAACCPSGASCTGVAPTAAPTAGPTAPVSYVPNANFPFPYAPTTFDNSAACASAVQACSKNYAACLAGLQASQGYPVTINVPNGGGTTVDGAARNMGPSATPICSSLSSQACAPLQATRCESFDRNGGSRLTSSLDCSLMMALISLLALVTSLVT